MRSEPGKIGERRCRCCRNGLDVCESLVRRGNEWICDPCVQWEANADDVDVDSYEQQRRERLAEAQEY